MARNSELLTIRCPEDLLQAIAERVKTTGQRKTDVVIQALRLGLGQAPESQNGSAPANNGNDLTHQREYLDKSLEEIEKRLADTFREKFIDAFEERFTAFIQHNQAIIKKVVKETEELAFTRFDALVQQKLASVQQTVKQPVLGPVKQVEDNVKQIVEQSVRQSETNVQQIVKHTEDQATQRFEEDVQQSGSVVKQFVKQSVRQSETNVEHDVQQIVKQPEDEAAQRFEEDVQQSGSVVKQNVKQLEVDDAAFSSDTEDEEISGLCELIREPDETPEPGAIGLPDTEEAERLLGEPLTASQIQSSTATETEAEIGSIISQTPGIAEEANSTPAKTLRPVVAQLPLLPETETVSPQEKKPKRRSSKPNTSALPVQEDKQLTGRQLAKKLGTSPDFIRLLESKGKLAEQGWALVEGTGTNDKNPPKYQLLESQEPT